MLVNAQKDSGILLEAALAIPKFCYPFGRPKSKTSISVHWESKCKEIFNQRSLNEKEFTQITLCCGLTRYLSLSMFHNISQGHEVVNYEQFHQYFSIILDNYHTDDSIAFAVIKQKQNNHILAQDIQMAVQGNYFNRCNI